MKQIKEIKGKIERILGYELIGVLQIRQIENKEFFWTQNADGVYMIDEKIGFVNIYFNSIEGNTIFFSNEKETKHNHMQELILGVNANLVEKKPISKLDFMHYLFDDNNNIERTYFSEFDTKITICLTTKGEDWGHIGIISFLLLNQENHIEYRYILEEGGIDVNSIRSVNSCWIYE